MSAYVIVELEVTNPEEYAAYGQLAVASVARHGGRFVVRGGEFEVLEGEWSPRMIVLEFESLDAARSWYHSDDYQECLPMRLRSSKGRMIAVEGLRPGETG
ncbi:MAG TPA: DUF1330 domain-containing protein [Acidimicrobiia bacterium]|nr:DUF1330 domain-containing protein [Acidimicrobiia bacterium]